MEVSARGSDNEDDALFELRVAPSVAMVSRVRRFVSDFYVELLGDPDMSHKLAMATHEMLENAVSYSSDGRSELIVSLHRRVNGEYTVAIQTKNRATSERLLKVSNHLDEVVKATDASELYNQLIRRAAKRRDGGSGLGLGRIRAEADLSLSYSVEGDLLVITAEGRFQPQAQQPHASPTLSVDPS